MSGGGTIDLDWNALTPDLAKRLLDVLNTALETATRPSFIGPVSVSSFEFGDLAPKVELVDLRDIYPDFLEDDGGDDDGFAGDEGGYSWREPLPPPDDFEWVPQPSGHSSDEIDSARRSAAGYEYGHHGGPPEHGGSSPQDIRRNWNPRRGTHTPGLAGSIPSLHDPRFPLGPARLLGGGLLYSTRSSPPPEQSGDEAFPYNDSASFRPSAGTPSSSLPPTVPTNPEFVAPDLQLHFWVSFESNLRLGINTSLQINYPSPMIMTLPIKLCITGLLFEGEVVVAYEGSRHRIHMCILDDQALGGPIPAATHSTTKEDEEGDRSIHQVSGIGEQAIHSNRSASSGAPILPPPSRPPKLPIPVGLRLLPSILIDSEIGQEDKHVLRNVARVERFIQDVVRKTLEEELVFPNFQTIVLPAPGDGEAQQ
jgi:distribution and morphology protein 12